MARYEAERQLLVMIMKLPFVLLVVAAVATLHPPSTRVAAQVDYVWDIVCAGQVRPIGKNLKRRARGRLFAATDTIRPCTKHVYAFSGKTARHLTIRLEDGDDVWMFFSRKGQNGHSSPARNWKGTLPADGEYVLTIVTTKPASYKIRLEFQ